MQRISIRPREWALPFLTSNERANSLSLSASISKFLKIHPTQFGYVLSLHLFLRCSSDDHQARSLDPVLAKVIVVLFGYAVELTRLGVVNSLILIFAVVSANPVQYRNEFGWIS